MLTLIDSDVLIWALRGNAVAVAAIDELNDWAISAITYMEVVQGCRNKAELRELQKFLHGVNGTDVLPIVQQVSEQACVLVEQYALSHSLHMADALIASIALHHNLPLLTGNAKHFNVIEGLKIIAFQAA